MKKYDLLLVILALTALSFAYWKFVVYCLNK